MVKRFESKFRLNLSKLKILFSIHLQPYVCDRCNKACSSSTYLKKHKKTCSQDRQDNPSVQQEYIEITSIPASHEDANMSDANAIILTDVAENSETYYVRIDRIMNTTIDEQNLVALNQSDGVEILTEIPDVENEMSDNIRLHIDDKNIYQTIDPNCVRIQVEPVDDGTTNKGNAEYFITSDCIVNK